MPIAGSDPPSAGAADPPPRSGADDSRWPRQTWQERIDRQRSVGRRALWRVVEAQHVVATQPLADSLEDQALLEDILEQSKPPVPASASGLHWLLFTPFRYPPRPHGTRFRAPTDPGVWYGADRLQTACAELGYWRWRFLRASPLERLPAQPQTAFRARLMAETIDLRRPPLSVDRDQWISHQDYGACQSVARLARSRGITLIRYESARDPARGGCGAVLHWKAFAQPMPEASATWLLEVTSERALWRSTDPLAPESFEFAATPWSDAEKAR